jgi:DNA/RNA-binding domain of Phe-tRNA-synthetase-like protein
LRCQALLAPLLADFLHAYPAVAGGPSLFYSRIMITIEPHPLLEVAAFVTTFPAPLERIVTSDATRALNASLETPAPLHPDEGVRAAVRDLLRHGGYKPTGRGKPSSEYLIRAVAEGTLGAINAAVDACNAVSLHSGLPISVIDLDRTEPPLGVGVAPAGARYVFNASGQELDLGGLLCLRDAVGPCANGVKDAQRTKTRPVTTRTLSIVWGTRALPGRAEAAAAWYRDLLGQMGATTT